MMLNLPLTTMASRVYAQPVAHLRATGFDVPQQERPGAQLKRLSFVPRFYDGCCEGSSERRSLLRGMSTLQHPSPSFDIGGDGLSHARGYHHV